MNYSPESIWSQLLKRSPIREREVPSRSADALYPVRRRAAFVQFDVPAQGALVASGGVYRPASAGAVVKVVSWHSPGGATRLWRWGVRPESALATSSAVSTAGQSPLYPPNVLLGTAENFGLFGIGDLFTGLAQGRCEYPNVVVMPGNVFIVADTGDNFAGEGGLLVEEFLDGSESL